MNKKEKGNLLGHGTVAEFYQGQYKDQPVTVKGYTSKLETTNIAKLQLESKVLELLNNQCLVHIIGFIMHPIRSVVLEKALLGTLNFVT